MCQERPNNDPFFPEIIQAWADAGIFGVFSNGNSGPACATSGSPGSRTANYSVGAYDSGNVIAGFSSRGSGQDETIKPNISAPGVDVRSSWPGSSYNTISGTSMAAPHVAGAIALLWSEYPDLVGNVETTRTLLDLTAANTLDDQCGGDAEDNNVYGEGRLDALALLDAAAVGVGALNGTVTDETGEPVAGALVSAAGPRSRSTFTGADGRYLMPVLAGTYEVTIDGPFGYDNDVQAVHVDRDATVQHDVTLSPVATVTMSGTVTDAGEGWPLGAKVTFTHESGFEATTTTDRETGHYAAEVVPNATYKMRVSSEGYETYEQEVVVGTEGITRDVSLTVSFRCTAPGYEPVYDGVWEGFQGRTKWQVVNINHNYPGYDDRLGWVFDDPGGRSNRTGGSGKFAIVDSDFLGQHHLQDTYLTSPVTDMTTRTSASIEFATELVSAVNSTASIELSTDGGQTWSVVWKRGSREGVDPAHEGAQLSEASGQPRVQVRFHYTGQWAGRWAIDDVFLGDRTCVPTKQ